MSPSSKVHAPYPPVLLLVVFTFVHSALVSTIVAASAVVMSLSKEDFLAFMSEQKKERDEEIDKLCRVFKKGVRADMEIVAGTTGMPAEPLSHE